jgi:hypothetical protein
VYGTGETDSERDSMRARWSSGGLLHSLAGVIPNTPWLRLWNGCLRTRDAGPPFPCRRSSGSGRRFGWGKEAGGERSRPLRSGSVLLPGLRRWESRRGSVLVLGALLLGGGGCDSGEDRGVARTFPPIPQGISWTGRPLLSRIPSETEAGAILRADSALTEAPGDVIRLVAAARALLEEIVADPNWARLSHVAAEADLLRLKGLPLGG